jgi:uncharacterized protein (DUF2147 family)
MRQFGNIPFGPKVAPPFNPCGLRLRHVCRRADENLCGYAVKTGEKILINMKPTDAKWTGQIHDPDSGRNYDSTIALKGANTLRVQGCAFGGMFCGGQTWNRVS